MGRRVNVSSGRGRDEADIGRSNADRAGSVGSEGGGSVRGDGIGVITGVIIVTGVSAMAKCQNVPGLNLRNTLNCTWRRRRTDLCS